MEKKQQPKKKQTMKVWVIKYDGVGMGYMVLGRNIDQATSNARTLMRILVKEKKYPRLASINFIEEIGTIDYPLKIKL